MPLLYFTMTTAFTLGLLGLVMHRTHLVSAMLCIEGMILTLYTMLTLTPQIMHHTTSYLQPIVLLTLAACGASMGLALLVALTRAHGTDHMNNLNLLQC